MPLAAFENADTDRSASDLRLILADLATRANTDDSRDIAQSVQSALVRAIRSRGEKVADHGIKHALFYVLLGARMPAILVETGFISNPVEEARLRTRDRQRAPAPATPSAPPPKPLPPGYGNSRTAASASRGFPERRAQKHHLLPMPEP